MADLKRVQRRAEARIGGELGHQRGGGDEERRRQHEGDGSARIGRGKRGREHGHAAALRPLSAGFKRFLARGGKRWLLYYGGPEACGPKPPKLTFASARRCIAFALQPVVCHTQSRRAANRKV